jgi:hypothetical protein
MPGGRGQKAENRHEHGEESGEAHAIYPASSARYFVQ